MTFGAPVKKSFFAKYWGWFAAGAAFLFLAVVALAALFVFVGIGTTKVTSLGLSTDAPVYGQAYTATVQVENTGLIGKNYHAALLVDGAQATGQDVKLESRQSETVSLDLSKLSPGKHTIAIGGLEKSFSVLKPAAFKVSGLTAPDKDVMVGDSVTLSARVENTGDVSGVYDGQFALDGQAVETAGITVEPGGQGTLQVVFTAQGRGSHTATLEGLSKTYNVLAPASVSVTALSLSKTVAKTNEVVTFTVTLENSGDLAGKYQLEILVNGDSAYTQEVAVDAGGKQDVPLQVSEPKAGSYTIQAGDSSQTLNVFAVSRPATGTLFVKSANSGYCTLTVTNSNKDRDAIIILTSTSNTGRQLLAFYVRAGEKSKKIKVKDGTYYIYYTTGTDMDSATKKFITNPYYGRFDDVLAAKTTRTYYQVRWTDFTLTLNVANGNASASPVDEGQFPQ